VSAPPSLLLTDLEWDWDGGSFVVWPELWRSGELEERLVKHDGGSLGESSPVSSFGRFLSEGRIEGDGQRGRSW
jgi:hypothetical protein